MGLKLDAHKIGAICIDTVHRDVAIVIRSDHITIGLKLNAGDVCPGRSLDDIGALKETVLASVPEGQVALAVCNNKIIIQWMEGSPGQSLLQGLRGMKKGSVTRMKMHSINHSPPLFPANDPTAIATRRGCFRGPHLQPRHSCRRSMAMNRFRRKVRITNLFTFGHNLILTN